MAKASTKVGAFAFCEGDDEEGEWMGNASRAARQDPTLYFRQSPSMLLRSDGGLG
jgi:hypothetical protein